MSISKQDVVALLLGSRTGAMVRKQVNTIVSNMTETERRALLESPMAARKHAWLATSTHAQRLRRDAYAIHAFEDDDVAAGRDSLELRDWFATVFKCACAATTLGSAPPREAFAAWRIFQERKHSNKVYIPRSSVQTGMALMGFPPHAADASLVSAPSGDSLVTHAEYSKMQRTIRAFVRNASVVRGGLSDKLDLNGLDDAQQKHARGVADTPFSCLNGRAGTGKSTLVSAIVTALLRLDVHVVCLAPTHRAKKNLANRLPPNVHLATIDAFIKSNQTDACKKSKRFLFVDEASMICLVKMARLARASMESSAWQVCLVGDAGQLEPIGRGEMFRTALGNGGVGLFTLEKCYRAENIDLFEAQTCIRDGKMPLTSASVAVKLLDSDGAVEKDISTYISKGDGAKAQFIAWTNKTCDLINRLVQQKVRNLTKSTLTPLAGDRVVYVGRNDTRKGLTNAMVGVVTDGLSGNGALAVDWEGCGTVECSARDVALAYCLTVHKAQGSEFDHVCVVATSVAAMTRSLDRRWLYTAVSRAKKRCDLVATKDIADFAACPLRKREIVGVSFAPSA